MATVQNLSELRARALQSVFPGIALPGPIANGPQPSTAPAPSPTRAQGLATPTTQNTSAASRAAAAVAAHLAANPPAPKQVPIPKTRENTPLSQSAGTINTNYVASARNQGYTGLTSPITPPDILAPRTVSRNGQTVTLNAPLHNREFFRNQIFVPTPEQIRANMFAPPLYAPPPQLPTPTPQVATPQPTFPPRNIFMNYLFPQ